VRTLRIRGWLLIAGCLAVTAVVYCTIHLRSRAPASPQAVASAEDEVYEAVVRDMVAPIHDGQAHVGQLVFNDTASTHLTTGADMKSCKETARKDLLLENGKLPYDSLTDKVYRIFTRSAYDDSLKAETIQNFLEKSCTVGRLSQTFHTDLPRTFIAEESVYFDGWPIQKNGAKSFQQMFPGASGIISFSHVGFDSNMYEALVSTSFVCGGLCGTGSRYVLRKKSGRWAVVNKWMVWVA
jgi:hypothetical protein